MSSQLERIRTLTTPLGWLSIVTVIVLLGLYAVTLSGATLIFALIYGAFAVYQTVRYRQAGSTEQPLKITAKPTTGEQGEMSMHVGATVDGLVRATVAINDVTVQQVASATEQAEVMRETNSLMDDFLRLSQRINEQARNISREADESAEISDVGQSAIQQSIESMDSIRAQVEAIGETIVKLAKLTQRIDEIITSVGEIATQSNLLALNASIEAARAGVHGRGFAVVAEEVRTLSQQSTQSAEQVRAILIEIQNAMKETVHATQMGVENVDIGLGRTREANDVMVRLAEAVKESRESVRDVYEVIQQQVNGIEEISINMDRIARISEQAVMGIRTVETVSSNLTHLANDLQVAIGTEERP